MRQDCGERPLLGTLLVQEGEVTGEEIEQALAAQIATGKRLGEILLDWSAVCGAVLHRALATQNGVELELEEGFGTGLRAELERRHRLRRNAFA